MKPVALILGGLVTLTAGAIYLDLRGSNAERAEADALVAAKLERLEKLDARLSEVADRFGAVESRLTQLESAPRFDRSAVESGESDVPAGDEDAAIAKSAAGKTTKNPAVDTDALVLQLVDPLTSHQKGEALWAEIVEKGLVDEVIAKLEERAEADPSNPDLQVDLAAGYLQKLFASKNPIEQGGWAMKMDQCYDKALTSNKEHWEARFSKAVSYSFWPAITGKPQESVKQFEMLRAQQEASGQSRPEYAETYVLLGNLYKQQGKLDQAKAAYDKGLSLFPQHESLKAQAGSL